MPEGPSVLNSSRFYESLGPIDDDTPDLTSTASCDLGDSATGGGYLTTGAALATDTRPDAGGNSWTVTGVGLGGAASLQAIAQCFDNPPLGP